MPSRLASRRLSQFWTREGGDYSQPVRRVRRTWRGRCGIAGDGDCAQHDLVRWQDSVAISPSLFFERIFLVDFQPAFPLSKWQQLECLHHTGKFLRFLDPR
jgi:hypothetical protein